MIKKIKKYLKKPSLIVYWMMTKGIFNFVPDKLYIKMDYKLVSRKRLNLNSPSTFNEKMQWLKLYDRKDIYTTMVDKCEAKKYVADIIGEEYIIPTIGVFDDFDDIDFSKLLHRYNHLLRYNCYGTFCIRNHFRNIRFLDI